jgi:adenylate cyclase
LECNASVAPDRRMQFRIGINQGDVLFNNERIFGDGVNVAARLEGLCGPGDICISGKVYEEIKNRLKIRYEDLGSQTLKKLPNLCKLTGSVFLAHLSHRCGPRHCEI